jgi:phage N-6-adenine-methyltransferase
MPHDHDLSSEDVQHLGQLPSTDEVVADRTQDWTASPSDRGTLHATAEQISRLLTTADRDESSSTEVDIANQRKRADAGRLFADIGDQIEVERKRLAISTADWCQRHLGKSYRSMRRLRQLHARWDEYERKRRSLGDCGRYGLGLSLELIGVDRDDAAPTGQAVAKRHGLSPNGTRDEGDYRTPTKFFDPLDQVLNFTIDVCATEDNAKCERYFTRKENGLIQSWRDERVWLNPPYQPAGTIRQWLSKAVTSDAELVAALLPASVNSSWWRDLVMPYAAIILFPHGRLTFGDFSESHVSQVALIIFAKDADIIRAKLAPIIGTSLMCGMLVND